jgi:hypothetical protein
MTEHVEEEELADPLVNEETVGTYHNSGDDSPQKAESVVVLRGHTQGGGGENDHDVDLRVDAVSFC